MEHVWSVLCRLVLVDQQSHNLTLVETLERFSFQREGEVEGIALDYVLATFWWRSDLEKPERSEARILFTASVNQVEPLRRIGYWSFANFHARAKGESPVG